MLYNLNRRHIKNEVQDVVVEVKRVKNVKENGVEKSTEKGKSPKTNENE